MNQNNVGVLVHQGYFYIALTFVPLAISMLFDFPTLISLLFLGLFGVVVYFFRNPEREVNNQGEETILSPIDGIIRDIEHDDDSVTIVIENRVQDTHLIRSAIGAKINSIETKHGLFSSSENSVVNHLNERATLIQTVEDSTITYELYYSLIPLRSNFYLQANETVALGSRIGFIGSGIVRLKLPHNSEIQCNVGREVSASESLIGFLKNG